jgi:hypothetical protein
MQPLPAADRHLPLQGEHRQREPPSEPGVALIAPAPARRGSFDIGRNHVVYGDIFPPFPHIPRFAIARVLSRPGCDLFTR